MPTEQGKGKERLSPEGEAEADALIDEYRDLHHKRGLVEERDVARVCKRLREELGAYAKADELYRFHLRYSTEGRAGSQGHSEYAAGLLNLLYRSQQNEQ